MSEAVGIVCPVCRSKLRLKGSVLSKATVPCPKCGTTLDVPKSETPAAPAPHVAPPAPAAKTLSRPAAPLASKPPQPKTIASAGNTNRSNPLPSADPPRKPKKPVDDIPNPYGDDVYEGSEDFFSGGDSEDLNSYTAEADPYSSRTTLPPRKRQKSTLSARSNAQSESSSDVGSTRRGGFLSWVGYGLLAAVAGIILQTVLGFTNYLFPLLIATIATGSMVGAAVRYAAGENNGWGPGIVAVLIAAFAIFAGRVGAFSVSPDIDKILGIPAAAAPLTPQEAEARVAQETTEPFLIADIAEEVEYDEDFLTQANLDEDAVMDFWIEHSEEEDPSKRYLPAVWAEASHRWNRNSPEQKETIRGNKEQELREDYGIMSEEDIQGRIGKATADDAMIAEIANSLYDDEAWLTKAGITKDQLDAHWENTDFDVVAEAAEMKSQHLPQVWEEATRRWNELPPEEKQSRIKQTTESVRAELVFSEADAKAVENIGKAIRIVVIIFGALFTLFWGIGSLICSISALAGAFKLGSGMSVAK